MRAISNEENKTILIDMLQQIHDFCCDHKLQYSLAYGTLLGCIRHHGFIPWDDDIDLLMPRKDFDVFAKVFNSYSDTLKLVCLETSSDYNLIAAKVINTETLLIEDVKNPFELGVYIDIFILDYLSDSTAQSAKTIKKLNRMRREYFLKTVKVRKGRSLYKNIVLGIAHTVLKPISTRSILKKMNQIARDASKTESSKCGVLSSFVYGEREIMQSEWYQRYELGLFEGRQFYIPSSYNEILSKLYGDYMTPPPKELQVTHHVNQAYWKE